MYSASIKEQLDRGIIEKVSSDVEQSEVKHYIPHYAPLRVLPRCEKYAIPQQRSDGVIRVYMNACTEGQ